MLYELRRFAKCWGCTMLVAAFVCWAGAFVMWQPIPWIWFWEPRFRAIMFAATFFPAYLAWAAGAFDD